MPERRLFPNGNWLFSGGGGSVRLEVGEYEAGDGAGEDAEHGVSTPQVHADRYDYSDDLG
jgi:hypothetical protein